METIDELATRRRIEDALRKRATSRDLIEIAEILGVNLVLPEFPNQVTCLGQIREGLEYLDVFVAESASFPFTVVKEPYFDRNKGWLILVRGQGSSLPAEYSLQNRNIFPEEKPNPYNYLRFSENSKHLGKKPFFDCKRK